MDKAVQHALVLAMRSRGQPTQRQRGVRLSVAAARRKYAFVPEALFAFMLSHFPHPENLWHLLDVDWASTWHGWAEAASELDITLDDASINDVASDYLVRFFQIIMNNADLASTTDDVRRSQLQAAGKPVGRGLVHGQNECCADSILQLMAHHALVPTNLKTQMPDATRARQAACAECRRRLVTHPNWDLRPVCRTDTGTIANATDAEHAQAYLQHDIHGEEIVRFFLQHFQSDYVVEPSGIRIIVYTRFDSVHLDPASMALVFGRDEAVAASRGQTCLDF